MSVEFESFLSHKELIFTLKDFLSKLNVLFYNPILVYFFLLMGISFIAILSSYPFSQEQYRHLPDTDFAMSQVRNYAIGFVAMGMVLAFGVNRMRIFRWWIYGGCMLLLIAIEIHRLEIFNLSFGPNGRFGVHRAGGAVRWINFGMSLQVSEFMRIALILVVGQIIHQHNKKFPHEKRTVKSDFELIVKSLIPVIPACFLIFRQPDSGLTILILLTTAIMLLTGGVLWRYILTVGGIAGIGTGGFLYLARYQADFLVAKLGTDFGYRISRFSGWFDPFGTIRNEGQQMAFGLLALGAGGLFGNGFRSATQYVPESHTDMIFTIIGADFGLLGTLAVVIIYGLFCFEILNTAILNRGRYNSLVCTGIFASLIGQLFWNIGMTVGLVPISGITLPFISMGGSSVLSTMMLLGMVLSAYVEGARIKHSDINTREHILYLKTKAYLKEDAYDEFHKKS
jgi:rod shape determining protein RodA